MPRTGQRPGGLPVFQNLNVLLRTLVLGGALVLGSWWTIFLRGKIGEHERALVLREERIAELTSEIDAREERIDELGLALEERDLRIEELDADLKEARHEILRLEAVRRLLKVDHRLAEIEVLEQLAGEDGAARTSLSFVELGPDGEPLGEPVVTTVEGRVVYLETLVIKFDDDFVEEGDALRGSSVCLFRRIFGEDQRPSEGTPIDAAGTQPFVYATDDVPDAFHRELWRRFWDYANDPDLAASAGVRAIHGEAPFMEARPGKRYRIELRASGGLTIRPAR